VAPGSVIRRHDRMYSIHAPQAYQYCACGQRNRAADDSRSAPYAGSNPSARPSWRAFGSIGWSQSTRPRSALSRASARGCTFFRKSVPRRDLGMGAVPAAVIARRGLRVLQQLVRDVLWTRRRARPPGGAGLVSIPAPYFPGARVFARRVWALRLHSRQRAADNTVARFVLGFTKRSPGKSAHHVSAPRRILPRVLMFLGMIATAAWISLLGYDEPVALVVSP
jgi:hypothetical protein